MFSDKEIDLITNLFQSNYGIILGVTVRYAPGMEVVDDIIQEVFIDFFAGFVDGLWHLDPSNRNEDASVVPYMKWRPLLCHIAKRKAQLFARRSQRNQRLVDQVAQRLNEAAGLDDHAEEQNEDWTEFQLKALRKCLEKLTPKSRTVIEQFYFEQIPVEEIAKKQNTTTATIHNLFYRVRIKLRECLSRAQKDR